MTRRAGLLGLLASPVAACSPVSALNAFSRLDGVRRVGDLSYGTGARRRLDLYLPASAAPAPVVVFFYGGSWEDGSKEIYRFVGAALASNGFLVAIPDYRLYPEVVYPDFLRDCAEAVAWVRGEAGHHGGDASRLMLMGHSAGAYNAAMLTLDASLLGAVGMTPGRDLRGFAGLAGPYDFLPLKSPNLKTIFGPEATRPLTQPIHYVSAAAPPCWLAAGRDDDIVDPGNSPRLAKALRAAGATAEVVVYPGIGHRLIIGAVSPVMSFVAPVLRDSVAFLRDVSRVSS